EESRLSIAQKFLYLLQRFEAIRDGDECLSDFLDDLRAYRCIRRGFKIFRPRPSHLLPLLFNLLGLVRKRFLLHFVETILKLVAELLVHRVGKRRVQVTSFDELAHIHLARIGMARDDVVKLWLCKLRLVTFIVTMPA